MPNVELQGHGDSFNGTHPLNSDDKISKAPSLPEDAGRRTSSFSGDRWSNGHFPVPARNFSLNGEEFEPDMIGDAHTFGDERDLGHRSVILLIILKLSSILLSLIVN